MATAFSALDKVLALRSFLPLDILSRVHTALLALVEGRQRTLAICETATALTSPHVHILTERCMATDSSLWQPRSPPQTSLSVLYGHSEPVVRAAFEGSALDGTQVVGLTLLQYTFSTLPGVPAGNVSSVQVLTKFFDNQHVSHLTTTEVTLRNRRPVPYEYELPTLHYLQCEYRPEGAYIQNIGCPSEVMGFSFDFMCPEAEVQSTDLQYSCPGRIDEPICQTLNGVTAGDIGAVFESDYSCVVTAFSATETTCECSYLPSSGPSGRRRLSSTLTADGGTLVTKEFLTAVDTTYFPLETTMVVFFQVQPETSMAIMAVVLVFVSLAALGWAFLYDLDKKRRAHQSKGGFIHVGSAGESTVVPAELAVKILDNASDGRGTQTDTCVGRKGSDPGAFLSLAKCSHVDESGDEAIMGVETQLDQFPVWQPPVEDPDKPPALLVSALDRLLPSRYFAPDRWYWRLLDAIIREHDVVRLMFDQVLARHRPAAFVRAAGRLLHILTASVVFSSYYFADDGVCEDFHDEEECLLKMDFAHYATACEWNASTRICAFSEPSLAYGSVMMLAFYIAMVCIVLDALLNELVIEYEHFLTREATRSPPSQRARRKP